MAIKTDIVAEFTAAAGVTVDGVLIKDGNVDGADVSALATASHAAVTLDTNADALLSLSTQEIGLVAQPANRVFAGPASGADADPTVRALVAADLPAATESAQGAVELATVAEAATGTDTSRAVTPAGLPLRQIGSGWALGTTGDARGTGAVDLQTTRNAATQVASAEAATVGGGSGNTASGETATVGGGSGNTASGFYATVGGGTNNTASDEGATVGGGGSNTASGAAATVGGGDSNTASGIYATVGGGSNNTASDAFATVGGGDSNTASGFYATVDGGSNNTASDEGATVGGGGSNTVSGVYATVPGGDSNVASGVVSLATGKQTVAALYGQQAHASGMFATAGDAQRSDYVLRGATSDGTQTELFLDGASQRLALQDDTTWFFEARIAARRTDANGESAAYILQGCIDRNAGTVALVGAVTKTVLAEDTAAWDVSATADDTDKALLLTVTGETGKAIRWVAHVGTVEVMG